MKGITMRNSLLILAKAVNYILQKSINCIYNTYWKSYYYLKYSISNTKEYSINIGDMTFKMSFSDYPITSAIIQRIEGSREKETVAIIKSILRHGDNVLEIGGCYGYFTIIMSKCIGNSGKVVSIEGTPNNYNILSSNLSLNSISNVDTYNLFITQKADSMNYEEDDRSPYDAIDKIGTDESSAGHIVETARLSSFLRDINYIPDVIFMDIEGFEVEVIEDLATGYYANMPTIVFEIHSQFYEETKGLKYISDILHAHGYMHRLIGGNMICIPISN